MLASGTFDDDEDDQVPDGDCDDCGASPDEPHAPGCTYDDDADDDDDDGDACEHGVPWDEPCGAYSLPDAG